MFSKRLTGAALRPLILSLLASGPTYGFQIAQRAKALTSDRMDWSNSKLYPLLHKLEHDGLLEAFWQPSESGPDRKYYRLTAAGAKELAQAQSEWREIYSIFSDLWDAEPQLS